MDFRGESVKRSSLECAKRWISLLQALRRDIFLASRPEWRKNARAEVLLRCQEGAEIPCEEAMHLAGRLGVRHAGGTAACGRIVASEFGITK